MKRMTSEIGVWSVEFLRRDGTWGLVTVASSQPPTKSQIVNAICDLDDGYHYIVADVFMGAVDDMVADAFFEMNGVQVRNVDRVTI
ncbi:hypothetical protein ACN9MY_06145 [Pseudoduganella sp. R-31]|uniref:hypothetical protein n=1 Tax=Pseudoduganella sp. R-31 TaxID=3404060 RepID=UPI003CEDEA61